ncbi:hypothetical protein ARALYDRAFT_894925 [Arabidopsis lyrata subsp. lyrata]|uniref:Uncharacterized protein n=1 Tax=Arabidopsis lyrata subsp. lyrata TaxID=81972 RepID=D7KYH0_ARALL|nr:hypothetical protein ARALYDRAFT_894925 [Arabidopsis lyrata subsp. lyrata]
MANFFSSPNLQSMICFFFAFGNDSNIDGIGGFSEEDTQSISKFMRVVIDMAVSGPKPLVNAAVIVDPSVRRIIATETDHACRPKDFDFCYCVSRTQYSLVRNLCFGETT